MRGTIAKRLRKIARSIQRPPETVYGMTYHPMGRGDFEQDGELRRRPSRRRPNPDTGVMELVKGRPIPRMLVLADCERRAYKEAKKIYAGR